MFQRCLLYSRNFHVLAVHNSGHGPQVCTRRWLHVQGALPKTCLNLQGN